ncbi:MAG TPA: prolipoprotein diacylglyceryl transferase [Gemmatimonadales bacterium]|nr:prolipoprotein diacylglyceryl transferase [Gemmatimonadales bacterium]
MTVYPWILHFGFIDITGYGLMMMVGFLTGSWLIQLELRRRKLREEYASDITLAAVIGGVVGAKLWYVVLMQDPGALFSRGGLVWYGGFLGGTLAVILNGIRLRVPTAFTAHLVAPALAAAYALGRIGCFLVNDDYGRPTTLPWGMKFPQGMPPSTVANLRSQFGVDLPADMDPTTVMAVHPTQLYEVVLMLAAFFVLWSWRTRAKGTGWLFGLYLVFAGCERFVIEIFRAKDDRFFGPFTLAQVVSVVLVAVGATIMARRAGAGETAPGPYLAVETP